MPPAPSPAGAIESPEVVRSFFAGVAPRYDLLNRLLSLGQDLWWRHCLVSEIRAAAPYPLLDLACGTGDVLAAVSALPGAGPVFGADFSEEMLSVARSKKLTNLHLADARQLPWGDATLGGICIAFGLRNFPDRPACYTEMLRVLKPGGHLWICEFSPAPPWFAPIYYTYLRIWAPIVARLCGSDPAAYRYLGDSIRAFPAPHQLASELGHAGFASVSFSSFSCRTVSLHRAQKPRQAA